MDFQEAFDSGKLLPYLVDTGCGAYGSNSSYAMKQAMMADDDDDEADDLSYKTRTIRIDKCYSKNIQFHLPLVAMPIPPPSSSPNMPTKNCFDIGPAGGDRDFYYYYYDDDNDDDGDHHDDDHQLHHQLHHQTFNANISRIGSGAAVAVPVPVPVGGDERIGGGGGGSLNLNLNKLSHNNLVDDDDDDQHHHDYGQQQRQQKQNNDGSDNNNGSSSSLSSPSSDKQFLLRQQMQQHFTNQNHHFLSKLKHYHQHNVVVGAAPRQPQPPPPPPQLVGSIDNSSSSSSSSDSSTSGIILMPPDTTTTTTTQEIIKQQVQGLKHRSIAYQELPSLNKSCCAGSSSQGQLQELFLLKLKLCKIIYRFDNDNNDDRGTGTTHNSTTTTTAAAYYHDYDGKLRKRQTLLEILDFVVNTSEGQRLLLLSLVDNNNNNNTGVVVIENLIQMIQINIFRTTTTKCSNNNNSNNGIIGYGATNMMDIMMMDDPAGYYTDDSLTQLQEPSWPHLQIVYELLLRYIIIVCSSNNNNSTNIINEKFCRQIMDQLTQANDPRERYYLKTILHRIYSKFTYHRLLIRKHMLLIFQKFVNTSEDDHHNTYNGIKELLEIYGSIIHGFVTPLKQQHVKFLIKGLLPLHKSRYLQIYHQQLIHCILQFLLKDSNLLIPILQHGILKYWPWLSTTKQLMFLNEIEQILSMMDQQRPLLQLLLPKEISDMLFETLASSLDLSKSNFQIVDRTLQLLLCKKSSASGGTQLLQSQYQHQNVLSILYRPLYGISTCSIDVFDDLEDHLVEESEESDDNDGLSTSSSSRYCRRRRRLTNHNQYCWWNNNANPNATKLDEMAQSILKVFRQSDPIEYDRCALKYFKEEEIVQDKLKTIRSKWDDFERLASASNKNLQLQQSNR